MINIFLQIHDIFKELLKEKITTMLNRLNNYKKEWINRDDFSIYTGNTGIAYLYYLYGTRFNDESYITVIMHQTNYVNIQSTNDNQ